jgi:pimeloyl-ACP methyl ester carboxylesterase
VAVTTGTPFVLVHGGLHGAWCWAKVVPLLEEAGHPTVAVDLPIEDPSLGAESYADTVVAAASCFGSGSPVIVVGHSLAGLVIPLVAIRRPTALMVFLCAKVPVPGLSLAEQEADDPKSVTPRRSLTLDPLGRLVIDAPTATDVFYHDCDPPDAAWASARLRPQAMKIVGEPCPLAEWPPVPSSYVLGQDDRAIPVEWARRAARERFGRDAIELPGGHSPFLARPAATAHVLLQLASSSPLR